MSLRVIVLTCQPFGFDTARALSRIDGIDLVGLFVAPLPRRSLRARAKSLVQRNGIVGVLRSAPRKLLAVARSLTTRDEAPDAGGVDVFHVDDLHGEDCLQHIRRLQADIGVVDGTGILRPALFDVPRLGCINLHCGKLPEYRGAPPAFWELFHGETTCGVSVHQVTAKLDAGLVYTDRLVPLEAAPDGDPMLYVRRFWLDVLRPHGLELIAETLQQFTTGTAVGRPQPATTQKPNRMPDQQQVNELRRRIALRRAERAGTPG